MAARSRYRHIADAWVRAEIVGAVSNFPWTVTVPEQAEVFYALEQVAIHTHLRVIAGERTGIRQSEETITETNLLELSVMLPNLRISTHTHKMESTSGADWEWWIEGDTKWFGMLVQAKKLHRINKSPISGYGFGYAPESADGDLQVDRLIHTAEAHTRHQLAPVYALYNGTDEPTSHDHCPFRVADQHSPASGITAMSAYTVRALAEAHLSRRGRYQDVPLDQARPHAIAWSCLATCNNTCTPAAYKSNPPQSWGDAHFRNHDPARHAATALNQIREISLSGKNNPNDTAPEMPLHTEPPTYVPRTREWIDGETPTSPLAHHLGVLYRDRPIDL